MRSPTNDWLPVTVFVLTACCSAGGAIRHFITYSCSTQYCGGHPRNIFIVSQPGRNHCLLQKYTMRKHNNASETISLAPCDKICPICALSRRFGGQNSEQSSRILTRRLQHTSRVDRPEDVLLHTTHIHRTTTKFALETSKCVFLHENRPKSTQLFHWKPTWDWFLGHSQNLTSYLELRFWSAPSQKDSEFPEKNKIWMNIHIHWSKCHRQSVRWKQILHRI